MSNSFRESEYKLKKNPFTGYRATKDELKFWVNRKKDIEIWEKVFREAQENSENNYLCFIIGDYGMGKSLAMYKIEEMCESYPDVFPVSFTFLGEERMRRPGIDFILRVFKYVDFNKIKVKKRQIEKIDYISGDVKNIFSIIFYGNQDQRNLASYFLRGQLEPNNSQMKELGIIRKIRDIEIAKEYFIAFLDILKIAGYNTLALIIDEFELLFSLVSKSHKDIYFALLRGLYDLPTKINENEIANIIFFLAVSKEEYSRLKLRQEKEVKSKEKGPVVPFMRRVYQEKELEPLSKKDVENLIKLRLRYNRAKRTFQKELLIPYTKDFVDFIWKDTGGKPGDIINKCGHILDVGIKYKVTKLDEKFAKKALEERKVSFEIRI